MKNTYQNTILLLDADGTITDLKTKKPNMQLIEKLGSFLDQKGRIAIVTGRTLEWVERTIMQELRKKSQFASEVIIVAEFGGVSKYKNKEGKYVIEEEKDLFIEPNIRGLLEKLTLNFKDSMFVDKDKRFMFTVEMKDNYSVEKFSQDRDLLEANIRKLLEDNNLNIYNINPTSIALDVRSKNSNKYFATSKALKILDAKKDCKFIGAGDNKFDSEMAEEAYKEGYKDTLLVYLGKDNLDKDLDFPVYVPKMKFTEGFLEFLNKCGY